MLWKTVKLCTSTLLRHQYRNISERISEKRAPFKVLSEKDVSFFEKLLGNSGVVTDAQELSFSNEDWLKTCKGQSKLLLKPHTTEEVSAIMKYCHEHQLAVCPQGGNTGLVGGSVPVFDEIILSTSRMNKIESVNRFSGAAVCQAGCILENLDNHVAEHGFLVPLDLGSKGSCQLGGNVSTNAGGLRLLRYGNLHGSVLGLECVLANGEILDCLTTLRKDNTGYDIKQLFIGSEGTLGVITKVAVLCPSRPSASCVALLGYNQFSKVLETFRLCKKMLPEFLTSFEFMDADSVGCVEEQTDIRLPIKQHSFYTLIEVSGSDEKVIENSLLRLIEHLMNDGLVLDGTMATDISQSRHLWSIRERITESLLREGYVFKYDVSVPLECYNEGVEVIGQRVKGKALRCCSFGHMGDSNLHLNVTTKQFSEEVLKLIEPALYEWTSEKKGSISAEHGIGLLKKKYLHYSKSEVAIESMRRLKKMMDPKGILNPYKIIP